MHLYISLATKLHSKNALECIRDASVSSVYREMPLIVVAKFVSFYRHQP